jgi:hypothetical protein
MTPEERQLITGLFDRMRNVEPTEKDREAEALINQSVRAMPDAPYMLVQSVLVQDQALQQADARIRQLEERVRALDQPARTGSGGGSFLGGLFGGGRSSEPQARPTSVPPIGSRPAPAGAGPQTWGQPPTGQTWGQPATGQPWAQPTAGMAPPQPAPRAGGGFLQSAISTAAGVAGGMLVADSIRGMLHGSSPFGALPAEAHTTQARDATGTQPEQYQDPSRNDPGTDAGTVSNDPGTDNNDPGSDNNDPGTDAGEDASYDDSGSDSGDWSDDGDWGGGDIET